MDDTTQPTHETKIQLLSDALETLMMRRSFDYILEMIPKWYASPDFRSVLTDFANSCPTGVERTNQGKAAEDLASVVTKEDEPYLQRALTTQILPRILKLAIERAIPMTVEREKQKDTNDARHEYEKIAADLQRKLNDCETRLRKKKPNATQRVSIYFVFMLLLIVGASVYIFWKGWAEKPEIIIEYNVGEIIGGILVGGGVAVAGAAYAAKTLGSERED